MATKTQSILPEIITGVFVVAIVALLVFFTVVISGMDLIYGRTSVARLVKFEHVGSLKEQDPVLVRGMKVGSVQNLSLGNQCVIATIRLNEDVPLSSETTVSVGQTSVLGGSCLEIDPGEGEPLPDDALLVGLPPHNVMNELGSLVADLRSAIVPEDVRQLLANLRAASEDVKTLTDRIEKGDGFFGKLLAPEDTLYADIQTTAVNLREITTELKGGRGFLGKLLREEDTVYADLQATLASLREVSEGLKNGQGMLGKLLREDDTAYADLRDSLANIKSVTAKLNDPNSGFGRLLSTDSPLVADLEAMATNLKNVTAKLESGEGTIGRLVNDDAVATEIEAAIKDVRQIIDNMRDTAPITTFSSLFFGGL